ncbi:MAG: DUF4143 domain-containing protein [Candidatus Omnitrophica bacterium]|nr:DUF4143 domain-containing protein [Candidatus Omnitrophota bacterium]
MDMPEEIEGVSLETLLFQELNAANTDYGLGYKIYYWRTADSAEVDFVYGGSREMRDGKISILSIEDALRRLPELLF